LTTSIQGKWRHWLSESAANMGASMCW